jgi:hypothetical protein
MNLSSLIRMAMSIAMTTATLGILAVGNAQAEQCPLVPSDATTQEGFQIAQLLGDGQFSQVEAALEKQHRKNLASEGGDLLTVRNVYELLQSTISQKENLMLVWADQRPQSFFAQFGAGYLYSTMASNARGNGSISQTTKSRLATMGKFDEIAVGYLQKAMQLDTHSALPHSIMIDIAAREGQTAGKNAEQWLQAANQVDPKNLAARINAVTYLSPRWGGSFELLDQMVQQDGKFLSAQSTHYLQYNLILAKASHEEVITKNKSAAYALYKRAKDMCDNSDAAQEGIIRTYQ